MVDNEGTAATEAARLARGARIKEALDFKHKTQAWLAEELGVSEQAVGLWIRTGKIARDRVPQIVRALHVTIDWFMTGQIPARFGVGEEGEMQPYWERLQSLSLTRIPVRGTVRAGIGHYYTNGEDGPDGSYVDMPSTDPQAFALQVRGGSMGNRIKDGEAVIVEPSAKPVVGEDVVLETRDGQLMVKMLAWRRNGEIACDEIGTGNRCVYREEDLAHVYAVTCTVPASRIKHL